MQPRHQATLTQPLQCVWQHHVANLHVSDDNNHAAIPVRSATTDSRHAYKYAQEQPLVAEHRGGTHSWMKRPQPQPPHTRGTFHRRLQPLYTEKHKVSCSGFLPNTSPMQQSCSHYNVFRSITSQTCTYLCTWQHQMTAIMQPFHCDLQPQIQDTHTNTHRNNHSLQNTEGNTFADETTGAVTAAQRRYLSSPAEGTLKFTRKNTRFRGSVSPQKKAHATCVQPLQCVWQHHVANLHVSTHMATPDDNNHAAIPLRSATTDSRHA